MPLACRFRGFQPHTRQAVPRAGSPWADRLEACPTRPTGLFKQALGRPRAPMASDPFREDGQDHEDRQGHYDAARRTAIADRSRPLTSSHAPRALLRGLAATRRTRHRGADRRDLPMAPFPAAEVLVREGHPVRLRGCLRRPPARPRRAWPSRRTSTGRGQGALRPRTARVDADRTGPRLPLSTHRRCNH